MEKKDGILTWLYKHYEDICAYVFGGIVLLLLTALIILLTILFIRGIIFLFSVPIGYFQS